MRVSNLARCLLVLVAASIFLPPVVEGCSGNRAGKRSERRERRNPFSRGKPYVSPFNPSRTMPQPTTEWTGPGPNPKTIDDNGQGTGRP